jgi:hypothetical protein
MAPGGGLGGGGMMGMMGGPGMPGAGGPPLLPGMGPQRGSAPGGGAARGDDQKLDISKPAEPQLATGQFQTGQQVNQPKDKGGEGKELNPPSLSDTFYKPALALVRSDQQDQPKEGEKKDQKETPPPDKTSPEQPKPGQPPKGDKPGTSEPQAPVTRRIIIRSGDIEFEVESFDSAVATVTKLVMAIKGGFVSTVNSDKLPNGKVKGAIVVRVPPETLDGLVLDLRKELGKGGELKGLKIGSQDITKQYTDLESRLKAARTMEERLLRIIKEGKGEIKQLLEAEKELGVWRTKIEEYEGEIRYYNNLAALSTLTITLAEKEIRSAVGLAESERVQAGIEVEDVELAQKQALAAVIEAKGRVTKSELKQHAAGQFNAILHFEVAPEAAGPLRDQLKQLGNMVRLEIDRVTRTEGGVKPQPDAKVKRGDTQFFISIYNLANVAPRETSLLEIAVADVPASYRTLREAIAKLKGSRVVTANLNEQDRQNVTAQLDFEVRRPDEAVIQAALSAAGEVLSRNVTRAVETDNVTDAKILYRAVLSSVDRVKPRETTTLQVAVPDVPASYQALQKAVGKAKGRVVTATLNEQDRQNVTAQLDFEVLRAEEATLQTAIQAAGEVLTRTVARAPENERTSDSKVLYRTTLYSATGIPPRETVTLGIEVSDVDATVVVIEAQASEAKVRRTVQKQVGHERSGRVTARLVYDVPLSEFAAFADKLKSLGTVRALTTARNQQAPEGNLAVARIDVTLSNTEGIVSKDDDLWSRVRKGLSTSVYVLSLSASWLIFGLCVVLPWGLVAYGVYRLVRRLVRPAPVSQAVSS